MIRAGLLAAALLLAACGQKADRKADEAPKVEAPAKPTLARATSSLAYTCEKDLPITAIAGTDKDGKPDLALIVKGQDFRLTPSAVEGRWTTQYGLEPGLGLAWWVKGDEALLQQAPFKTIDDPAVAQTVRTCKVKTEPSGTAPR